MPRLLPRFLLILLLAFGLGARAQAAQAREQPGWWPLPQHVALEFTLPRSELRLAEPPAAPLQGAPAPVAADRARVAAAAELADASGALALAALLSWSGHQAVYLLLQACGWR